MVENIKAFFKSPSDIKVIIIIVLVGLVVYFNSLFNGFVWDDRVFILNNPEIHSVNILKAFVSNSINIAGYYRPIYYIYFSLLYFVLHDAAFLYHLLQLMLHIINTVLLFAIFKKFFKNTLSFFLSLIFLLHPINVESVAYISTVVTPLFTLFGLLSLYIFQKEKITLNNFLQIAVLLFLSILTKEEGILYVVILLIYSIIYRKKIVPIIYIATSVLLSYFFIRFVIGKIYFFHNELVPIGNIGLIERIINIPAVTFYYIKTFLYPVNLTIYQIWLVNDINLKDFYLPLVADIIILLLIMGLGIYTKKNNKKIFKTFIFFSCWFAIGMLMHLQLIPLDMTVADRWFYFPIIGLLGILGVLFQSIKNKPIQKMLILLGVIILIILSFLTIERNSNWKDPLSLYVHDNNISTNYALNNNIGSILLEQGKYEEAIPYLIDSIDQYPFEVNYANLGLAYNKLDRLEVSIKNYKLALSSKKNSTENKKHLLRTYTELTELYISNDMYGDAVGTAHEGLIDYPKSAKLWFFLAYSEYKLNNFDNALNAASYAYKLDPNETTGAIYNRINNRQPLFIK